MKIILVIAAISVIGAGCSRVPRSSAPQSSTAQDSTVRSTSITSFEECVAAGNPILESYPAQCVANEQTFFQATTVSPDSSEEIVVTNPSPDQLVTSPLQIIGKAKGSWFFEANFSAELIDANATSLGEVPTQAEGEWMTDEMVPFSGEIIFADPVTATGTLILKNANPSGLSENEKQIRLPVRFR